MFDSRKNTNKLMAMIDEGMISAESVVMMFVGFMSERDITKMMDANELTERFENEEE